MSSRYPELRKLEQMALERIKHYSDQFGQERDPNSPVRLYAKDLMAISKSSNHSPEFFTCQNPNYWRVLITPGKGYELALITNAYVYAAFGQLSWSKIWLLLESMSLSNEFRSDFDTLLKMINIVDNRINRDIHEGIKLHDQGKFQKAIEIYDHILAEYPYSAWARYEKSYSLISKDPTKNQELVQILCEEALKYDPFYPQAYGVKSPNEIEIYSREVQPFLTASIKDDIGLRTFAYGCHKLRLFEIAGHAIFRLLSQSPHDRDLAFRFIVSLTEYGVDDLAREITPTLLETNKPQPLHPQKGEEIEKMQRQIKNLYVSGNYREAHKIALQGLEYARIQFGVESLEAARFLYDVGNGFFHLGNAKASEEYIQLAIKIYKRELGSDSKDVGYALNSLAAIYMQLGQIEEAETCLRRVITIWENKLSLRDFELALAYHNLGSVLIEQGRESESRPKVQRAIYILENTSVPPAYAAAPGLFRLTLTKIERNLGNFDKALEIATEAKEIVKSNLNGDHPNAIQVEKEFANIYRDEGKFTESAEHLKTVLEMQKKVYGFEHPEIAHTLNNLAQIYECIDMNLEAEELYLSSLDMRKKLLGNRHPDVATPLNNLGLLYAHQKRLIDSEQLLQQALEIREKTLSSNHPILVQTIHNLGIVNIALNKFDKALSLMERVERLDDQLLEYRMLGSNEFEKEISLKTIGQRFEVLVSLVCQHMTDSKDAINIAFEAVTRRKGLLTAILANERVTIKANTDLSKKLRNTTNHLASLAIRGSRTLPTSQYVSLVQELNDRLDKLEVEISTNNNYDAISDKQFAQTPKLSMLPESLPGDTALIEYVMCPMIDFTKLDFKKGNSPIHYLAFIIRGGKSTEKFLVNLGPVEGIDKIVRQHMSELEFVSLRPMDLETERHAEKVLSSIGRELYSRVFAPIEPLIENAKAIFIAPDGELNLLAFGILKNHQDRYLIEEYQFSYLVTTKDLRRFRSCSGEGMFIFADPNYDLAPFEIQPELDASLSDVSSLSAFFKTHKWNRLAGTHEEAQAIAQCFMGNKVNIFLGENAREDIVKQLVSPQILHLATHGFFLQNEYLETGFPTLISKRDLLDDESESTDKKVFIQFPALLRSGLVFAGANQASRCPLSGDVDDGILTALEASTLKLWNTDLVVLSACEAGLGVIDFYDSVIGLRRAFLVAGAQTLVTSLWPVPDKDTATLMTTFYRHIKNGNGRAKALHEATIEALNNRRKLSGTAHPFYWGAFICLGNTAPIVLNI
jgi:CHAT domain-containing protein/tetratricopeptide (TPR) repeat protein